MLILIPQPLRRPKIHSKLSIIHIPSNPTRCSWNCFSYSYWHIDRTFTWNQVHRISKRANNYTTTKTSPDPPKKKHATDGGNKKLQLTGNASSTTAKHHTHPPTHHPTSSDKRYSGVSFGDRYVAPLDFQLIPPVLVCLCANFVIALVGCCSICRLVMQYSWKDSEMGRHTSKSGLRTTSCWADSYGTQPPVLLACHIHSAPDSAINRPSPVVFISRSFSQLLCCVVAGCDGIGIHPRLVNGKRLEAIAGGIGSKANIANPTSFIHEELYFLPHFIRVEVSRLNKGSRSSKVLNWEFLNV